MSSNRRKKKKKQANRANRKQTVVPKSSTSRLEKFSEKEHGEAGEQADLDTLSTGDGSYVDNDLVSGEDVLKPIEELVAFEEPDEKEENGSDNVLFTDSQETEEAEPGEVPQAGEEFEEPSQEEDSERQSGDQEPPLAKEEEPGEKLRVQWIKAKGALQKAGCRTAHLSREAGKRATSFAKGISDKSKGFAQFIREKAPVYTQRIEGALKKVAPRYWIAGAAAAGAALIALVMVGIFTWEWFGLVIHQRPVEGTWSMEQAQPATFLTLREDGTAIVSTDGLSVNGVYNLLEDDRISFDVATKELDVWVGEFHYWATDSGLTLTRLGEGATAETTQENVLQFGKQEEDVTQVPVPENPQIDTVLIGSWSDVSKFVTYTFHTDGTLVIDFQGAYYNATYSAEEGQLEIITYIPGQPSKEEDNAYTVQDGMLSFSNMELIQDNT